MKVILTGGGGFIGKNLRHFLRERGFNDVACLSHKTAPPAWRDALATADFVFHLAGVNRSKDESEFVKGNVGFTDQLCAAIESLGRAVPVLFTSSFHADRETPYGKSKHAAERRLRAYGSITGAPVFIYRLPNVFGKGCRPNYNSVVATFCHRIARGESVEIHNPDSVVQLVYIDDVLETFLKALKGTLPSLPVCEVNPVYTITVSKLARQIKTFRENYAPPIADERDGQLTRALYATYLSYI